MGDSATLVYAHDPMCSWCWAFAPTWAAIRDGLERKAGNRLQVRRLLGGLAPDSDAPMPEQMRAYLQQTWAAIQQRVPGTEFNFEFWTRCAPRRSTWPACRAVIAARRQAVEQDEAMTRAIQEAYYLGARNPSDRETLVELAREAGLDAERFAADLDSEDVRAEHEREMELVGRLGIRGFPSLVLVGDGWGRQVPASYGEAEAIVEQVFSALSEAAAGQAG